MTDIVYCEWFVWYDDNTFDREGSTKYTAIKFDKVKRFLVVPKLTDKKIYTVLECMIPKDCTFEYRIQRTQKYSTKDILGSEQPKQPIYKVVVTKNDKNDIKHGFCNIDDIKDFEYKVFFDGTYAKVLGCYKEQNFTIFDKDKNININYIKLEVL